MAERNEERRQWEAPPPLLRLPTKVVIARKSGGPIDVLLRVGYHLFIGLPLCFILVSVGCLLCLTIIGIPLGLTLIAAGFKAL